MNKKRTWIVGPQSPTTLGEVLLLMKAEEDALADGRVFINRKRTTFPSVALFQGDTVDVFPVPRGSASTIEILASQKGIVAVYKPEGLSTIPDQRGQGQSLLTMVASQLGISKNKLHPTSRLDFGVSGVILFATTEESRNALVLAREQKRYQRHYLAICSKPPVPGEGIVEVPIGRGQNPKLRKADGKQAVPSKTLYQTAAVARQGALVGVEPITGRTHQIRVHMAHIGAPLVGDPSYGGPSSLVLPSGSVLAVHRIALHAAWVSLALEHAEPWTVHAPVPQDLRDLWTAVGGQGEDWERCLAKLPSFS